MVICSDMLLHMHAKLTAVLALQFVADTNNAGSDQGLQLGDQSPTAYLSESPGVKQSVGQLLLPIDVCFDVVSGSQTAVDQLAVIKQLCLVVRQGAQAECEDFARHTAQTQTLTRALAFV